MSIGISEDQIDIFSFELSSTLMFLNAIYFSLYLKPMVCIDLFLSFRIQKRSSSAGVNIPMYMVQFLYSSFCSLVIYRSGLDLSLDSNSNPLPRVSKFFLLNYLSQHTVPFVTYVLIEADFLKNVYISIPSRPLRTTESIRRIAATFCLTSSAYVKITGSSLYY